MGVRGSVDQCDPGSCIDSRSWCDWCGMREWGSTNIRCLSNLVSSDPSLSGSYRCLCFAAALGCNLGDGYSGLRCGSHAYQRCVEIDYSYPVGCACVSGHEPNFHG